MSSMVDDLARFCEINKNHGQLHVNGTPPKFHQSLIRSRIATLHKPRLQSKARRLQCDLLD